MFYLFYNLVVPLLIVPVSLFHFWQKLRGLRPPPLAERFGRIPGEQLAKIGGRPVIWVHAVSVGETLAARPLLDALRARYPEHAILVSNSTATGREVAGRLPGIDLTVCFPFDFLPAVNSALDAVAPRLVVIMETEVWPNFTRAAVGRGIPVLLANGRISDRSFGRYLRFRWVFRPALRLFSSLCMQTALDRDRIVAIGARSERALPIGNLKCDIPWREVSDNERQELRGRYRIPVAATVITAGSTRPGEEELVVTAYRELLAAHPDAFLVLAPRHPERTGEVAKLLELAGISYRRRSELDGSARPFAAGEVLLVDCVGELMNLYALADLVFVGGSLVPLGGHNLLEPASVGVPLTFGPHMNNFREITALVLRYEAGIQVTDPRALGTVFSELLADDGRRRRLAENALKMMRESGGATTRHMEVIERYLPVAPARELAEGAR